MIDKKDWKIFQKLVDCLQQYAEDDIWLSYQDFVSACNKGENLFFESMYTQEDVSYAHLFEQLLINDKKWLQDLEAIVIRILYPLNNGSIRKELFVVNDLIWNSVTKNISEATEVTWCTKTYGNEKGIEIFFFKAQPVSSKN